MSAVTSHRNRRVRSYLQLRSVTMSTVRQVRGMILRNLFAANLMRVACAVALAGLATTTMAAAPATATLKALQQENGHTVYSLSLTPPADVAKDEPCDVVILFDTSASQSGAYRETALAALEACIAKLRPTDRVQLLAADLEARPITPKFLAANSEELTAAI